LLPAAKKRLAKRRLVGFGPDSEAVKKRGRAKLAKALEKQRAVREKRFQSLKLKKSGIDRQGSAAGLFAAVAIGLGQWVSQGPVGQPRVLFEQAL
jgi:hypothetical protein